MDTEVITISSDTDVMSARLRIRELAAQNGIEGSDLTLLATAISEIARNIVQYAGEGRIECRSVREADRQGVLIIARDNGPGIVDIEQAMQDGFSTSKGMGLGLPGAKRLMDDFEIVSAAEGTTVSMAKWGR